MARETLVKKFARLNRVDTALARKQFTEDGERLLSQVSTEDQYDPAFRRMVLSQWRRDRGLVNKKVMQAAYLPGFEYALNALTGNHGVVDQSNSERYWPSTGVWDHARYHALPGGRLVAVGLATYTDVDPNEWLTDDRLIDFIDAMRSLDLAVRVGFEQDQYYGMESLPILIWNPNYVGFLVV